MLISVDFEIGLAFPEPTALAWMLYIHPSHSMQIRSPERLTVDPPVSFSEYLDRFGNRCGRALAPTGIFTIRSAAVVEDSGLPDFQAWGAQQHRVHELPDECLLFLLPSRYCEVDSELKDFAFAKFGHLPAGWSLVLAVCDFAHNHVHFDYQQARANRTALDVFRERVGVCRDFTHLAVTLCRCLNLPARYCTGYLGDIGIPLADTAMDFSAWFEVYLGGRWYAFDARNNIPRIGRILVAYGRDAADVALTTTFGASTLHTFRVGTVEVDAQGRAVG